MKFILTGAAGFIGMHTARSLLELGHEVIGVDNLNDYYDARLKKARLDQLMAFSGFRFVREDVGDAAAIDKLFREAKARRVVHLAAQAGVRHSLENPQAYVWSNLVGFASVLEACRRHGIEHLVFGSSSSVYGNSPRLPSSEHDAADRPLSLYAASKRSNELMAHSYSHLYGLPTCGLRFFTVYGPWGRPDMAPMLFAQAISTGQPIEVFNHGDHRRDFTFVDDIVSGIAATALADELPRGNGAETGPDPALSSAPFRLYNVGNSTPVKLLDFIGSLERHLGKKAQLKMVDCQPGDVKDTWADCSDLERDFGYRPGTGLDEGVGRFVSWFKDYYGM